MAKEIRKHMGKVDGDDQLSGVVEIDDTYIGGHKQGKRGRGAEGKTIVMGMVQRDGDVIAKVVPNIKKKTLQTIIENNVEAGSEIHTDELTSYQGLDKRGYKHSTVNHGLREYVRDMCHVNAVENFWARLKLSIKGTHVHVSGKYLQNYVREFEYRFNSRKVPQMMFDELISSY